MATAHDRFHGRLRDGVARGCDHAECDQPGEFRAPKSRHPELDGYHHFCLEHVRAFNATYDYFEGMSREEIEAEQRGHPSWDRTTVPFGSGGREAFAHPYGPGQEGPQFDDPLKVFGSRATASGPALPEPERQALATLGLEPRQRGDAGAIRRAYKALVRRYHPDSNGGDRRHEAQLRKVIDAYTQLATPRPRAAKTR